MMEVILLERVEKLGQMGEVVNVRDGFARNFLLPQKKALRATQSNRALFEKQRAQLEAENLKRRQEAETVAERAAGIEAVLVRQAGESGQLYGSVSSRDIRDALEQQGLTVARSQVDLDKPIKALGQYEVTVRLHPEVPLIARVTVARSQEEAEQMAAAEEAAAQAGLVQDVALDLSDPDAEAGAPDALDTAAEDMESGALLAEDADTDTGADPADDEEGSDAETAEPRDVGP